MGLEGCDQKSKPTQENFKAAIQSALDKRPALCAQSPAQTFPFDEPKGSGWGVDDYKRAQALASAGLLKSTETKIPLQVDKSITVDGAHFALTDEGKKYLIPAEAAIDNPKFCGGKVKLRDITSATAPVGEGVGSQVLVTYAYDVVDAPAWTHNAAMQKIFADDLRAVSETTNARSRLELTQDGWSMPY
ncbi:hypothetical protein SAMN05414139_10787 [Burkholderia sp. D7]|nr:hypothetical protein SAMN05414139_10787 [Burkholderia sp. D7]